MQQQPQPSIWAQMSYTPPRGPCSQKTSMVTSCACYRFMIHPLKAGSSFDCDGCGHHASFHRMESREEEEIARRWKAEVVTEEGEKKEEKRKKGRGRGRGMMMVEGGREGMKRIGGVERDGDVVEVLEGEDEEEEEEEEEEMTVTVGRKRKGRG